MSKKHLGVWKAWLVALSFCCGVGGVEVPPALGAETTTSVSRVVHSLYDKAHAFAKQGPYEAAISVWDDLIHRFATSKNPMLRQAVASALNNENTILSQISGSVQSVAGSPQNGQLVNSQTQNLPRYEGSVGTW